MHLNLQTFNPTITIKHCGKLETAVASEDHYILLEKWVRWWLRCSLCPGRKNLCSCTQRRQVLVLGHKQSPGMEPTRWFAVTAAGACSECHRGFVPGWWHLSLLVAPAWLQKGELPFWRDAISSALEVNCLLWAVCQSTGMVYPNFRKCLFLIN